MAVAVDSAGNAYLTGEAPGSGSGATEVYVVKLNAAGNTAVYTTGLGGTSASTHSAGNGIAVDSAGKVAVVGVTDASNFPTSNAYQTSLGGGQDAFAARLSADGSSLVFSTYLGGSSNDAALGVAYDNASSVYLTGWTASTNFPTTLSAGQTSYGGGSKDAFVTELASSGALIPGSLPTGPTYLRGSGTDEGHAIAVFASSGGTTDYVTGSSGGVLLAKLAATSLSISSTTIWGSSGDAGRGE
jgi:hypothetical protein